MNQAAETLRITAFAPAFADFRSVPIEKWWQEATGSEPAQVNRSAATAQAIAEGQWQDVRLSLVATPGRVDWHVTPITPPGAEWMNVGSWPDCVAPLATLGAKWLSDLSAITRVAFGAVVITPVVDRLSGYRIVQEALSDLAIRLPEGLTDFLVQFNLAVDSRHTSPAPKLNRLARWGVSLFKPIFMQMAVVSGVPANVVTSDLGRSELYAVKTELDFSTAAEWTNAMSAELSVSLLEELLELARAYVGDRFK